MPEWKRILGDQVAGIDHVAIAVPDLDASVDFYTGVLGFDVLDRRETRGERTGMVSAVVQLGQTTIVLVQGTEPASQVSRFVEECGPGVQHIAIEVHDLAKASTALQSAGLELEMPMIEGPYTRQVFSTRHDRIGVRIELIERRRDGFDDRAIRSLFLGMEKNETW